MLFQWKVVDQIIPSCDHQSCENRLNLTSDNSKKNVRIKWNKIILYGQENIRKKLSSEWKCKRMQLSLKIICLSVKSYFVFEKCSIAWRVER